jgi:ribosome-binding ATPase YchF (GTP1/OBG family)
LGNKFLSHIRECSAVVHVLRSFESSEIHHVNGVVNPAEDFEIILTELILADLESIKKQIDRVSKKAKTGDKESKKELSLLEQVAEKLNNNELVKDLFESLDEDEQRIFKSFNLITVKQFLIVANVGEEELANFDIENFRGKISRDKNIPIIPISAQIEADHTPDTGPEAPRANNKSPIPQELLQLRQFPIKHQERRKGNHRELSSEPPPPPLMERES